MLHYQPHHQTKSPGSSGTTGPISCKIGNMHFSGVPSQPEGPNIWDPSKVLVDLPKSDWQSFYAVSPMATKDGFIIQYLPQHQSKVQRIRARLQDRLVAAQAVWGHWTLPADSSDALPSATWQAILELSMVELLAPRSIPHDITWPQQDLLAHHRMQSWYNPRAYIREQKNVTMVIV